MAYRDLEPPYVNEYHRSHPKWYGVPPKGERSVVGDFDLHIKVIATVLVAVLLFTYPYIRYTIPILAQWGLLVNIAFYAVTVPIIFMIPILLVWFIGKVPIFKSYLFQVLLIILVEIGIWAIYRKSTADYFEGFGTFQMYAFHIVAAPTIHLIPILVFWWVVREERGLPFVFSKRLLLSGLIVGFLAAIFWRLLEEFIYTGLASSAGGSVPDSFAFWNLLETPNLFIIMTFVHFFIVGPVEELEFRGFTQDQAARVLPNWQAVTFSSILFGCSHIPIAIFLYRFSTPEFIVALIGWISAGFVFGFLYMWSRNIYACIIMHGMGNWQLSVYYFQSVIYLDWVSSFDAVVVGTITSIIANAIMIVFFYFVFKFYWEPHRRGEPAFGGAFINIQRFMHDHDFGKKSVQSTLIVATIFCVVICGMWMGAAAGVGKDAGPGGANMYVGRLSVIDNERSTSLDNLVELDDQLTGGNPQLAEGASDTININSEPGKYIKSVKVTVTWTDEPDIQRIRTYENNPDTFTVSISGANETASATASNTHGQQGTVTTELEFELEELEAIIETEGENYGFEITISLDEAGDLYPPVGVIIYTDTSNAYDYTMDIVWLTEPEE